MMAVRRETKSLVFDCGSRNVVGVSEVEVLVWVRVWVRTWPLLEVTALVMLIVSAGKRETEDEVD